LSVELERYATYGSESDLQQLESLASVDGTRQEFLIAGKYAGS
jgi:hypothetical protein